MKRKEIRFFSEVIHVRYERVTLACVLGGLNEKDWRNESKNERKEEKSENMCK